MVWFCCKYLVKGVCTDSVFTVVDELKLLWFLLCRSHVVSEGC